MLGTRHKCGSMPGMQHNHTGTSAQHTQNPPTWTVQTHVHPGIQLQKHTCTRFTQQKRRAVVTLGGAIRDLIFLREDMRHVPKSIYVLESALEAHDSFHSVCAQRILELC